jgi:hypothetical protein
MLGKMLSGLLIVIGVVGLSYGQAPKAAQPTALMPDPTWVARPGDKVSIYVPDSPNAPAAFTRSDYDKMAKAFGANDQIGLVEWIEKKSMVLLPTKLQVLILQVEPTDDLPILEIRVMEGEHLGKKFWMFRWAVARLIEKPSDPEPKPATPAKAAAKPVDRATRAATLLQSAKNLEKSGKPKPAIEGYQRIAKDFPDTPSARAAFVRLKELGVK